MQVHVCYQTAYKLWRSHAVVVLAFLHVEALCYKLYHLKNRYIIYLSPNSERRDENKYMKRKKERRKSSERLKYERNCSLLNLNRLFHLFIAI
jgi:hypothetical protein